MNIKNFMRVDNSPGEFIFIRDILDADTLNFTDIKYGFRVNIFENFDFGDDCILIDDNFINDRVDYIIKHKMCHHAKLITEKIPWNTLKNGLDINNLYIVFHVNRYTIAQSDLATADDPFNLNIQYNDWLIKRLIE